MAAINMYERSGRENTLNFGPRDIHRFEALCPPLNAASQWAGPLEIINISVERSLLRWRIRFSVTEETRECIIHEIFNEI